MTSVMWIWTHLSFALIIVGFSHRRSSAAALAVAIFALVASIIPIGETDLSGHIIPYTGSLSIGSLIAIGLTIKRRLPQHSNVEPVQRAEKVIILITGVAGAAVLASATGFFSVDVYGVGYQSSYAYWGIAVSALAYAFRCRLLAIGLVAATISWQHRAIESTNLWDYVLDPWLTIFCLFLVGKEAMYHGASQCTETTLAP